MVKLIPVLVSNSISRNIIPGILKAIERHAIIFDMDKIMDDAAKDLGVKSIRKVGKKIQITESDDNNEIVNSLAKEFLNEQVPPNYDPFARYGTGSKAEEEDLAYRREKGKQKAMPGRLTPDQEEEIAAARERGKQAELPGRLTNAEEEELAAAKERGKVSARPPDFASKEEELEWYRKKKRAEETGKRQAAAGDASVSIGQFDMKSLNLEPSWMKADLVDKNGVRYSTLVGVKAIPVVVKSDARLADLIMWDAQIGKIMRALVTFGRKIEGFFYRKWARLTNTRIGRIFSNDPGAISGNPYKDIVLKRTIISTKYVKNVYFVLNKSDLTKDFFNQAKKVRQLMNLGWQSFVVADDVNRTATFCMIKFRGMCSTIPYTMLYHTIDQAKIFEDLEDVRRSSASLFKVKKPMNKFLGEGMAQSKLDEFSAELFEEPKNIEFLNELDMLNEGFGQFVQKIIASPKAVLSRFIKGSLKLPSVGAEKLAKLGNKIDKDFHKSFKLAQKVVKNSLTVIKGQTLIDWIAMLTVVKGYSLKGGKGLVYGTREALKKLIPVLRRIGEKVKKEGSLKVPPEHLAEVVIAGSMVLVFAGFIGYVIIGSVRKSYEITRAFNQAFEGMYHYVKIYMIKLKSIYNHIGVEDPSAAAKGAEEGAKEIVRKTAETATEAGEQFQDVGGEWAMLISIVLLSIAGLLFYISNTGK